MSTESTTTESLLSTQYRVDITAAWGEEGYDRMEKRSPEGWRPVSGWGQEGWDLGSWPYVVISHRTTDTGYELLYDCEGDTTVYRYPTPEMCDSATDELAFFHWKGEPWVEGIQSAAEMPARLKGRCTNARMQQAVETRQKRRRAA